MLHERTSTTTAEHQLQPVLALAFAPLHKAAFGVATGTVGALVMMWLTATVLISDRGRSFPLGMLSLYFAGYDVSWPGLFIGALWGFGIGFFAGWFVAFCRNVALAIATFSIRTRAELDQTREFLDHI
jgi:hypothetical protein